MYAKCTLFAFVVSVGFVSGLLRLALGLLLGHLRLQIQGNVRTGVLTRPLPCSLFAQCFAPAYGRTTGVDCKPLRGTRLGRGMGERRQCAGSTWSTKPAFFSAGEPPPCLCCCVDKPGLRVDMWIGPCTHGPIHISTLRTPLDHTGLALGLTRFACLLPEYVRRTQAGDTFAGMVGAGLV